MNIIDNPSNQKLNVQLEILLPQDSVVINKVVLEELQKQSIAGVYWTMKDLEKRINRKSEWIKENILYPSKFRTQLDVECGGFVFYPNRKGQTWLFHALRTSEFLDKNFQQIFSK